MISTLHTSLLQFDEWRCRQVQEYNALYDRNLSVHFSKARIQDHLYRSGLVWSAIAGQTPSYLSLTEKHYYLDRSSCMYTHFLRSDRRPLLWVRAASAGANESDGF